MALWTPDVLGAALFGWYDASDATKVIITGSGVSQWVDKSGQGNHAVQTTDANRPTFSVNKVSFAFQQGLMFPSYPAAWDVIFIAKMTSTVAYHTVLMGVSELPLLTDASDPPLIGHYTSSGFASSGLTWARDTYAIIYGSVSNLANCTYARDGSALVSTGQPSPNETVVSVGRVDYEQPFGDLYEMIFVTYGATTDTKQKLEGYIAWKWGYQGNLPVDHPYKSAAPTTGAPGTPWLPTDLGANLKGWFDGKDVASVTITGSGVSAWANKGVSTMTLTQGTDANRPTYASNILTFAHGAAATGPHLLATNALTNYDVLIIGKPFAYTDTTDWRTLIMSGTQNNLILENVSNHYGTYNTNFFQAGTLSWDNVAGLSYAQISAGNPLLLSRDGSVLVSTGTNPTDTTIAGIGSGGSYSAGAINQAWGDINELFFVPFNSSIDTRQRLEGYAAWKWSLQGNLPVDHPYKSAAPTTGAPVVPVSNAAALMIGV